MALVPAAQVLQFDIAQLERIILTLADRYDIRISFTEEVIPAAGFMVGLAVVGGIVGALIGARFDLRNTGMITGAVGGAGVGGVVYVSLRGKWPQVKAKLKKLYDIVYNYLRSLKIADYIAVGQFIYDCKKNREYLVRRMIEFIDKELATAVQSSITKSTE